MIALVMLLALQTPPDDPAAATLMQVSIVRKAGEADAALAARVADLRRAAPAFTTCDGAFVEAKRMRAEVTMRYPVPLDALPPPLRASLMARPIGRATPSFVSGEAVRVLLRCPGDFRDKMIDTVKTLKHREDTKRGRTGT